MATHSRILAWRIPWMEEPGGLRSMGSQRVRHDWSDLVCTHVLKSLSRKDQKHAFTRWIWLLSPLWKRTVVHVRARVKLVSEHGETRAEEGEFWAQVAPSCLLPSEWSFVFSVSLLSILKADPRAGQLYSLWGSLDFCCLSCISHQLLVLWT